MDLFHQDTNEEMNLLPYNGTVVYYGTIFSFVEAKKYFDILAQEIEWKSDEAIILGKHIFTKRKVAWYAEEEFSYTYSNITKVALPFTPTLFELKKIAEKHTGHTYNSCLLNLYNEGDEGMAWHSDGEKDLKKNGAIASMSFGAERKFAFKNKETKATVSLVLQNGSLLVMKDETQTHWQHRLPPTAKKTGPRINLTFRTIVGK